ncbi:hypothetical protein VNO78_32284 [Psophocarpus tetragonolobus]|uniref:Uncharacterized protein n=1 Tax=Psophocarpus tetragonolobus TaxID=3891 RepID=A0AAN9NVA4_PSOTE
MELRGEEQYLVCEHLPFSTTKRDLLMHILAKGREAPYKFRHTTCKGVFRWDIPTYDLAALQEDADVYCYCKEARSKKHASTWMSSIKMCKDGRERNRQSM